MGAVKGEGFHSDDSPELKAAAREMGWAHTFSPPPEDLGWQKGLSVRCVKGQGRSCYMLDFTLASGRGLQYTFVSPTTSPEASRGNPLKPTRGASKSAAVLGRNDVESRSRDH